MTIVGITENIYYVKDLIGSNPFRQTYLGIILCSFIVTYTSATFTYASNII